jgi:hypothetical protein
MARNGDGRLKTIIVARVLEEIEQTTWSNGWSGFAPLGSPPTGAVGPPTIAAGADGKLVLFGSNGQLWRLDQAAWGGAWSLAWIPHNAPPSDPVTGPPNMILDAQGCLQLFVVYQSGKMWNIHQTSPAGAWSAWTALGIGGAGFDDHPAVALSADGRLELFVRGQDNALWHAWQLAVGGAWSAWVSHGNAGVGFQDHPAVAPSADGRLELFMTGLDGNLWHIWQTVASNGWSGWANHGHP